MSQDRPETAASGRPFRIPLPVDPCRIILGMRERWFWLILLPLLLGGTGLITGLVKTEDRYSVSLQLLRAEVPAAIQASQEGTAFKPRQLSDETLLAVTYASEVMSAVGDSLDPPRSGNAVKSMVEINKQRGTDFFYITAHSRFGAEDAIATVNSWAREIVAFTRELQRREARDMYAFLGAQVDESTRQLESVNEKILTFSQESEFYDAEKQTESYLASLENLQMRQAEARIELQSKAIQIERYREELRNQSPLFEELRRKQKELTFLQGRYTNDNPLVKEKLHEIAFLQERLEQLKAGEVEDLKEFTGSDLGNNLYLEILALENERTQLQSVVETYQQLIAEKRSQVASLPQKQMSLRELNDQRQQLLTALSLMDARRKEAEFFINNPPGYWKIFQTPDLRDVSVRSQPIKALLLAFAAAGAGLLLALTLAIVWELRQPGLRTPLQAAIATHTRPVLLVENGTSAGTSLLDRWRGGQPEPVNDPAAGVLHFWLTEMAKPEPPYATSLFVAVDPVPQVSELMKLLATVAGDDDAPLLLVPMTQAAVAFIPPMETYSGQTRGSFLCEDLLGEGEQAERLIDQLAGRAHVILLATEPLRTRDFKVLKKVDRVYLIASPGVTKVQQARLRADVILTVRGPLDGLILVGPVLRRTLQRLLFRIQMQYFGQRNRTERQS